MYNNISPRPKHTIISLMLPGYDTVKNQTSINKHSEFVVS